MILFSGNRAEFDRYKASKANARKIKVIDYTRTLREVGEIVCKKPSTQESISKS